MAYLAIAYPELPTEGYQEIQRFRSAYDRLFFNIVNPHFTFIFPVTGILQNEFIEEVKSKSASLAKFNFHIRQAILHKDELSEFYYVFLIPDDDEPFIQLHDILYSEKLNTHLRHDIEYVPHMTIGNSKERIDCQKMADEWNKQRLLIEGTISRLTIIKFENGSTTNVYEIELQ